MIDKVTWTDGTQTVELTCNSNGNYVMPDSETAVTISVSFKENNCPSFSGHSLVLSDDIGVRFRVAFPEGVDTTNLYVVFVATDGRKETVTYADAETISGSTDRYFIFRINALELAEDITATLYYGDNLTITDEYSAITYIQHVQNNVTDNAKLLELVNSLQAYGYYMQVSGWTDDKPSHKPIPAPETLLTQTDIETAVSAVSGYTVTKLFGSSGLVDSKFSLTLNSKTTLNFSVRPGDGVVIVSNGYKLRTIGGKTYYQFSPAGKIGPKNLGKDYSVTVVTNQGSATFTASAMAYLNLAFSSGTLTEQQQAALAAYYFYYVAAYNY